MNNKGSNEALKVATLSASYNIILQISMRFVTFIANALILRHVSRNVLGLINVRLLLLYTTIQFVSREPFRRSCFSDAKTAEWRHVVNLIWLCLPLSLLCGTFLSLIWCLVLEQPDPSLVSHYHNGVFSIFISVVIELLAEPLYVYGQLHSFIKFRVVSDGIFLLTRSLIMVLFVPKYPLDAIHIFSWAQITSSVIYVLMYYIYFIVINSNNKLRDFLPKVISSEPYTSPSLLLLIWTFFKQTALKQFLTEGERFVMTFFNTITFAEQGIYDVINNLGSIPARLVFHQIEESGYFLFSQKLNREKTPVEQDQNELKESSQILSNLLKLMIIIGLIILTFGFNYSQLALLLYGGRTLSDHQGVSLLRWHCVYILFIAINGITECFTFAAMNKTQIDQFNKRMVKLSIFFLISAYLLTKLFGSQGFILANCLNMITRIMISFNFISSYYRGTTIKSPLDDIIPDPYLISSFVVTFVTLYALQVLLCCDGSLIQIVIYIFIGILCLMGNLTTLYIKETGLIHFSSRLFKRSDKLKDL